MRRLIRSDRATADLFAISDSYAPVDPELPDLLLDKIIAAPRPLLERPSLGSPLGVRGLCKWPVRNTPFLLLYRLLGNGAVEIARVRHVRADWQPA